MKKLQFMSGTDNEIKTFKDGLHYLIKGTVAPGQIGLKVVLSTYKVGLDKLQDRRWVNRIVNLTSISKF